MAIGGYVRIDYIQDFDGGYDRFQYEIQNVPVEGDGQTGTKWLYEFICQRVSI